MARSWHCFKGRVDAETEGFCPTGTPAFQMSGGRKSTAGQFAVGLALRVPSLERFTLQRALALGTWLGSQGKRGAF